MRIMLADCQAESDVVFVIDDSSYMGKDNFLKVKVLIQEMVDKMALYNDQSRVAIITYSDGPKVM